MSPHEAWFGKKPSVNYLHVFGCTAYATLPIEVITKGNKANSHAIKSCFLGYRGNRMYCLLNLETGKIFTSRDVSFDENQFFKPEDFKKITQDFSESN
jgi:hypothetical protein